MFTRASINARTLTLSAAITVILFSTGCDTAWHLGDPSADVVPLIIITQPLSQTIPAEQSATFTVVAHDGVAIAYQWYQDKQLIPGATASSYTATAMPFAATGSKFTVSVKDSATTVNSQAAILTVTPLSPNLAFAPVAPHTFGDQPFALAATSLSAAPIAFAIQSGPANLSGSMLGLAGPGKIVVTATQPAAGDYTAGVASASFNVAQNVSVSPVTPANQTMAPGPQAFTATAAGGLTNTLLWTATGGSFTANLWNSPNTVGRYTITATSADDSTKSAAATVTISAPIITRQPIGGSVCTLGATTLSVAAIYDRTYQWSRNGLALNGAANPTYSITAATSTLDNGAYTVAVSNPAGTVTSSPATMVVGSTIITNPSSLAVSATQTATFTVAASGMSPFTYQWFRIAPAALTGIAIPGATASTYTTSSLTASNNGDQYYATVTDSCGALLTSTSANLSVAAANVPPTIVTQPIAQTITPGGAAGFDIVAIGTPTLTYQWYRIPFGSSVGSPISGATSASYTLPSSATTMQNDQDAYYAVVTNNFGEAASLHATLAVGGGITITRQPASVYINAGAPARFSVAATSLLPLSYQWYTAPAGSSTFALISGATATTYTLPSTVASVSGSTYYVIVSNGITPSVQSNTAALFIGPLSGVDSCGDWNMLGNAIYLGNCSYQLTAPTAWQGGEIVWPALISTANLQLSFTIATSEASPIPADGFAVVFGDPSLGATLTSQGLQGEGLGARDIPGMVVAFDDYENDAGYFSFNWPQDPQVPYLGVGRGENDLWETPYFNANTTIPALADPNGLKLSHDYVVRLAQGHMTVTMDGLQVFSGSVNAPPIAYLYVTASTGSLWERTIISHISAVVSSPSP